MIKFSKLLTLSFLFFVLWSCSTLIQLIDADQEIVQKNNQTHASIIFSHNINGELEPCGCRKFPLGGMEQAYRQIHQIHQKQSVTYIDTGDLFFPSPQFPDSVKDLLTLNADVIAKSMKDLKLDYFLPGDQDFALGIDWLKQVSQTVPFAFLISNLKITKGWKYKKYAVLNLDKRKIFLLGVIDPHLLSMNDAHHFSPPNEAITDTLKKLRPREDDIVILLSHMGMDEDKIVAQNFPRINWIIGAHSQSYTTYPHEEGKTKIVQAMSRNHFLGQIQLSFNGNSDLDQFGLLEIRHELAEAVTPNPLTNLLNSWRSKKAEINKKQQANLGYIIDADEPLPTFNSCLDCHKKQTEFWGSTAHSMAWNTLVQKNSDNDSQCIGCHALGFQKKNGFMSTEHRVKFNESIEKNINQNELYLKEFKNIYVKNQGARAMPPSKRKEYFKKYTKLMNKYGVTHDFGNVQCLHCHDKNRGHPFDTTVGEKSELKPVSSGKCIICHTPDQSPEWWESNNQLNDSIFQKKLKDVTCPKD